MTDDQWDTAELPTKFNKYRRLKEKSEKLSQGSGTLSNNVNESSQLKIKLEMTNGNYESPPPSSSSSSVDASTMRPPVYDDRVSSPFPVHSLPQYRVPLSLSAPNFSSYRVEPMDVDACEIPLNLSVPSAFRNCVTTSNWSTQSSTFTLGATNNNAINDNNAVTSSRQHPQGNCDTHFVDDHFQRSLGSVYATLQNQCSPLPPANNRFTSNKSSSPAPSVHVLNDAAGSGQVSVTGSVDDHFSKSLGDLWTKVKGSSPASETSHGDANRCQPLPTSVDDHFAKALGDTWYKIQANKNSPPRRGGVGSPYPPPRRQPESPQRLSEVCRLPR